MTEDDVMDRWLRSAMTGEAPRLSSAFDAKVMARVRRRRLTPAGRIVLAAYAVGAAAVSVWTMREVGVALIAASTLVSTLVAVRLSTYVRMTVCSPR
jgi:hypothetical protein